MRNLGTALVALLLAALSAPAYAQTGPSARIASPSDGAVLNDLVSVRGEGSAATGVRRIKIMIGSRIVAAHDYSELRQEADVTYSWNTVLALAGGPAPNGSYQLKVEVTASGGATDAKVINVSVDNAPQTPTGLAAAIMDRHVELSWAANPEPDIIGYLVEGYSGESWSTLARTAETRHAMKVAPGTYQYRVSAVRSSPTMAEGRPSAPSEPHSVTVAAPRASGGTGPGGGGKGSGTYDRKIFGRDGKGRARDVAATARRGFARGGFSSWNLSLPGQVALPEVPRAQPLEWGSYKERLPYSIPKGGMPLASMPTARLAAISTSTFIPADGLRWVAAGLLMVVIAGLMQMLSMMAARVEQLAPRPAAVGLPDAIIRIRRVPDRVRTTWQKARGG